MITESSYDLKIDEDSEIGIESILRA